MATQAGATSQQSSHNPPTSSSNPGGSLPQDAHALIAMIRELGVGEFEPRVVNQLMDFAYGYVKDVLTEARSLANHAGHKQVDSEDVRLAVQLWSDRSFGTVLPAPSLVAEMAQARNSQPLPVPRQTGKPVAGLRLPPDRHCLTQAAFQLRSQEIPYSQSQHNQQRFIASSYPPASLSDHRPPAAAGDHRSYVSGPNPASRPPSSLHGSAMQTDYDI